MAGLRAHENVLDEELGPDEAWQPRGVPGRTTLPQRLMPRPQIVFRVAEPATAAAPAGRNDNGVAAGADAAVDRAAGSTGAPLRGDLRARFESSLGADLSRVR
ncbi:MAG TPA: hypothetical protein VHE35_27940, partial [Kofleriaceae bacterium]|nr:hypothetical protein [Kofleriaceae bacterium]